MIKSDYVIKIINRYKVYINQLSTLFPQKKKPTLSILVDKAQEKKNIL